MYTFLLKDNGNLSQNFPSNSTEASSHKIQLMEVPQATSMGTWNQMSMKSLLLHDSGNPFDTEHHPLLRLVKQWWTINLFSGFSGTASQKVGAGAQVFQTKETFLPDPNQGRV